MKSMSFIPTESAKNFQCETFEIGKLFQPKKKIFATEHLARLFIHY